MPQYKWMKLIIVCLTVVLPVCFMMSCKNSDIKINEQQKDSEITGFDAEFKFSAEGGQGSAVSGDTFFACSSRGACVMYNMNTGEKIAAFEEKLDSVNACGDKLAVANMYKDIIIPAMDDIRADVDAAESITCAEYWPYPSYGDLLFSVQ